MAQRPWDVLKEQNVTMKEAHQFLEKAAKEAAHANQPTSPTLKSLSAAVERVCADNKLLSIFASNKRGVFRKIRCRGLAQLLPLHINQVNTGISLFLETFELNYVPELAGLWICSRKPTLESTYGFSCDSEKLGVIVFPFQVEVLVFAPRAGASLVGVVNAISADGLTCLVLDSVVVNIELERLLVGSVPKINEEDENQNTIEVHEGKNVQTIKIGSKIKFSVHHIRSISGGRDAYALEGSMRAGA